MTRTPSAAALIIAGHCDQALWGLSAEERQGRVFRRCGVTAVVPGPDAVQPDADYLLVGAAYVLQENLVQALVDKPEVLLVSEAEPDGKRWLIAAHCRGQAAAGITALIEAGPLDESQLDEVGLPWQTPRELGPSYNEQLRKRAAPFCYALGRDSLEEIEKGTFKASYKGATDFVTKYCWPYPARLATRWAAERRISPNSITTVSLVFVIITFALFWNGHFLLGCLTGWFMTFLDTVDGKLARVTLTSSKWGNLYDHGIDLIHPPFWYWAWWQGLQSGGDPALQGVLWIALWIILAGYILGRVEEGIFLHGFKIQIHIWRPMDFAMRTITARRNPNLFLLMIAALLGRPDLGFLAVAIWTVFCLIFHGVRIFQALAVKRRGGTIESWMKAQ